MFDLFNPNSTDDDLLAHFKKMGRKAVQELKNQGFPDWYIENARLTFSRDDPGCIFSFPRRAAIKAGLDSKAAAEICDTLREKMKQPQARKQQNIYVNAKFAVENYFSKRTIQYEATTNWLFFSYLCDNGDKNARKRLAKHAIEVRHSRPNGSKEKQAAIRALWASGKYSSRTTCAEQEFAALEWNYSSARKALIGEPEPKP